MENDSRSTRTIAERIEELRSLHDRELLKPAPYEDCFSIMGDPEGPYGGLKPDLDTYTYTISSFALGARTLLKDSTGSLLFYLDRLGRTFFERYPLYADLEKSVTREDTPDLYEELESHERARKLLLELIRAVLESRGETTRHPASCFAPAENRLPPRRAVGSSPTALGPGAVSDKRSSRGHTPQQLVEDLRTLEHKELSRGLAPYEDCLRIMGDPEGPYAGFNFELDWYMYAIASFARAAKKLTTDTVDSLRASQARFSKTFFEACPRYANLETLVTRENTPRLFEALKSYERARKLLLELIQTMLESRDRSA